MSWNIKGSWYESCSCKMVCRCTLGPAEPDQGWCSTAHAVELEGGTVDGVAVAGARFLLLLDLPGDFTAGVIDKARLHFDSATTSPAQRDAIEAIYHGKRGGVWEGISGMVGEWLPSKVTSISLDVDGDEVKVSVDGAGGYRLNAMRTETGNQAKLVDAPVVAAFGVETVELAVASDSKFADPDMRVWEGLGFGGRFPFDWSG